MQDGNIAMNITYFPPQGFSRFQYIHYISLQKADGRVYLVFWHEISNCDTSSAPCREIFPPVYPITVQILNSTYANFTTSGKFLNVPGLQSRKIVQF
jgi:hypothetical protein